MIVDDVYNDERNSTLLYGMSASHADIPFKFPHRNSGGPATGVSLDFSVGSLVSFTKSLWYGAESRKR